MYFSGLDCCHLSQLIVTENFRKEGSANVEQEEYDAEVPMEDLVPRTDIAPKLTEELCDKLKAGTRTNSMLPTGSHLLVGLFTGKRGVAEDTRQAGRGPLPREAHSRAGAHCQASWLLCRTGQRLSAARISLRREISPPTDRMASRFLPDEMSAGARNFVETDVSTRFQSKKSFTTRNFILPQTHPVN